MIAISDGSSLVQTTVLFCNISAGEIPGRIRSSEDEVIFKDRNTIRVSLLVDRLLSSADNRDVTMVALGTSEELDEREPRNR